MEGSACHLFLPLPGRDPMEKLGGICVARRTHEVLTALSLLAGG
jgi:hypothetical protein